MACIDIFAERLVELRESNKTSQQQLADYLGISRQALSLYEKGQRRPDIEILFKIADYFQVSADYLIGRIGTKTINTDIKGIYEYTGLTEEAAKVLHQFKLFSDIQRLAIKHRHQLIKQNGNINNSDLNCEIAEYIDEKHKPLTEKLGEEKNFIITDAVEKINKFDITPQDIINRMINSTEFKEAIEMAQIYLFLKSGSLDELYSDFRALSLRIGVIEQYKWSSERLLSEVLESLFKEYIKEDTKEGD